ncbi:hypothetical protein B0J14DRAFT_448901, partial [Halenospora varia]
WRIAVARYLERQLTNPEDRLPALSGIAQNFQDKDSYMGAGLGTYLAGHWSKSLLDSLSWNTPSASPIAALIVPPAEEYIAPSWSWASTQAAVEFYLDRRPGHGS